jgi:peptide subunit release factor RF-3
MLTIAMWQGLQNDSISAGNTRLLMIFVGVVAASMFMQTVFVILTAIGAAKTQKRVLQIAEEFHTRATPIIDKAEDLVKETLPKIRTITDNLVEASAVVKAKALQFDTEMIHKGIRTPVVEALAVVNGFKAGIDVLLRKSGGFANSASVRKNTAISLYKDKPDEL